ALACGGALLVVGGEGFAGATKSLIGDLLIIGNSLAYGLYLVLSKPMMARHSARRVVARMFAIASGLMLPIGIWPMIRQPWAAIPLRAWIGLLLVILGRTVAAYLLKPWALRHAGGPREPDRAALPIGPPGSAPESGRCAPGRRAAPACCRSTCNPARWR